jgi:hypothetical protein
MNVENIIKTLKRHHRHSLEGYFDQNKLPEELYHYTNVYGLKGILENASFWATHFEYLNDGLEITYGDDLICRLLLERQQSLGENSTARKVYEQIVSPRDPSPSITKRFGYDFYVISFSANGDLLDQWRAYGADGNGYSIGIKPYELNEKVSGAVVLTSKDDKLNFFRVLYSQQAQKDFISTVLDTVEKELEPAGQYQLIPEQLDANTEGGQNALNAIADALVGNLLDFALMFKHPAFENEQEVRLLKKRFGRVVSAGLDDSALEGVKFRTTANQLVPYIEIPFYARQQPQNDVRSSIQLPLKRINLGPKHDKKSQQSLEMYLQSIGYADPETMPELYISEIPYQ